MSFTQNNLPKEIMIVDDDKDFHWVIENILVAEKYKVIHANNGEDALKLLEKEIPDTILLDYRMPGRNGIQIAGDIQKKAPSIPIIMITGYSEVKSAVKAMKMGVYDYITKPVDNSELLFSIKRAMERQDYIMEVGTLRKALKAKGSLFERMGNSDQIEALFQQVSKVGPTLFTVLIQGESGAGKELVACAIHDMSKFDKGPFVAVDCGAIPETLIESELFGYNKGAFSGAYHDKAGYFEMANQGTLFLDEVGNLPYAAQQKLLRAIQEHRIQRLGAKKTSPVSCRVVAATNQDLEKDKRNETFRSDLYFRLKEFVITIPPLRERTVDIPYLSNRFLEEAQKDLHKKCSGFSKTTLSALLNYQWPGNVRELRNVIRQAVLLCEEGALIDSALLLFDDDRKGSISNVKKEDVFSLNSGHDQKSLKEVIKFYSDNLEKKIIKETLVKTSGNKSEASRMLEIDYKTLLRKIKTHNITG